MGSLSKRLQGCRSMRTQLTVEAMRFPLLVLKKDNHEVYARHIVLTKEQLQAAQLVGQSTIELIHRFCYCRGYEVLEIGKPEKKSIRLSLDAVWEGVRHG